MISNHCFQGLTGAFWTPGPLLRPWLDHSQMRVSVVEIDPDGRGEPGGGTEYLLTEE